MSNYTQTENQTQHPLQQAWKDFALQYDPFQFYITLTFKKVVDYNIAYPVFCRFILRLNKEAYGNNFTRSGKGVYYLGCHEYQKRGASHFHLFLGGIPNKKSIDNPFLLTKTRIDQIWKTTVIENKHIKKGPVTGFTKIRDYKPSVGAYDYITKYVVKEGDVFMYAPKKVRRYTLTTDLHPHNSNKVLLGDIGVNNRTEMTVLL